MRKREANLRRLTGFFGIVFILFVLSGFSTTIRAQSPTPQPSPSVPQQEAVIKTMAENLRNFTGEAVAARQSFIQSVERPMMGWLIVIAQVLAVVMFLWAIADGIFVGGGFELGDIYRIGMRAAVGFLLLFFCGDVDGDGVKGDLLNYPASVGAYYAYGVNALGNQEDAYLARTVRQKEEVFDGAYRKFVENKLMVSVNNADLPVQYPTAKDINLLSALYIGKFENEADFEKAKSQAWRMEMLYASLDFTRGLLSFADLFLFLMQGFAVICLRLALPLMIGVMFYKSFGQKVTVGYLWTATMFCLIFPGVTQFLRLMFYGAGSVVFGIGGDNPYYAYDAATGKITATGNPEVVIIIGIIYMAFAALTLFASFFLTIYLSQGKILEGVISTFSGWFTAAASIGMGVATGGYASRKTLEAEETQQTAIRDAAMVEANYSRIASETGARGSNEAANLLTKGRLNASEYAARQNYNAETAQIVGTTESAKLNTYANQIKEWAQIQSERNAAVSTAYMNLKQEWDSLGADARRDKMMNIIDMAKSNNDADAKFLSEQIKQHPELLEVGGKKFEEAMNSVPLLGQIAKTAGFNSDLFNFWKRNSAADVADNNFEMVTEATKNVGESQNRLSTNIQSDPPPSPSPSSVSIPRTGKGITKNWVAQAANDEMIKLGYTPQARLAMLGNLGRENSWNPNTIFQGHYDPANNAFNVGIISWQGNRRTALLKHLGREGFIQNGKVVQSEGSIRSMVRFMDSEMQSGRWGKQAQMVRNPVATPQAISGSLQKYILYSRKTPYNTPDANFDVVNNRVWADKARGLVIATTPERTLRAIEAASPAVARVLANQKASKFERDATIANNKVFFRDKQTVSDQFYSTKENLATERYGDTVRIAEDKAQFLNAQRLKTEQLSYTAIDIQDASSRRASQFRFQGATGQGRLVADAEFQANQVNLQTALQQANLAFESRQYSTAMQYDGAMKAAKIRALAAMAQNIGDKAGHHLSEASEKFSRL